MTSAGIRRYALYAFACIALFGLDRFVKILVVERLKEPVELIPSLLELEFTGNEDFIFGLSVPFWLIVTVIVIVMVFMVFLALHEARFKRHPNTFFIMVVLVGAISNLIDRVAFGYVVDYVSIPKLTVFNIADAYIVVSVAILFILMSAQGRKKQAPAQHNEAQPAPHPSSQPAKSQPEEHQPEGSV